MGPYITVGTYSDWGSVNVIGGAAFRVPNSENSSLDVQIYGGCGHIGGTFGADIGVRICGLSTHRVSHWDVAAGCQFCQGVFIPTVSVGLYIWGIPVLICLGFALWGL